MTFNPLKLIYFSFKMVLKVAAFLCLFMSVVFLFLQTPPGKKVIKEALKSVITPYAVDIKEIKGFFPFHLILETVTIYENKKKLAECGRLEVAWSPFSLNSEKLVITNFSLHDVTLYALPTSSSHSAENSSLWRHYVLEEFKAHNIKIDEHLVGMPVGVSIEGAGSLKDNAIQATLKVKSQDLKALSHRFNLHMDDGAHIEIDVGETIQSPVISVVFNNPSPLLRAHLKCVDEYKKLFYEVKSLHPGISLKDVAPNAVLSGVLSLEVQGTYDLDKRLGMTTLVGHFENSFSKQSTLADLFRSPLSFSSTLQINGDVLKLENALVKSDFINLSLSGYKAGEDLKVGGNLSLSPTTIASHKLKVMLGQFDYQNHKLTLSVKGEIDGYPVHIDSKSAYDPAGVLIIKSIAGQAQGAKLKGNLKVPFNTEKLNGNISLNITDLSQLNAIIGHPLKGKAFLKIALNGTLKSPTFSGFINMNNLNVSNPQKIVFDSITTRYTFKNNRIDFLSVIKNDKSGELRGEGHIPLHISFSPFIFVFPPKALIKATLKGNIDLSSPLVSQFLDEDLIKGTAMININMKGTRERPLYNGSVTIKDGYWENLVYGTTLKNLELMLEGDGDSLVIKKFSATDKKQGSLSVQGSLSHLLDQPQFFLTLAARNFTTIHNDEIQSAANADLKLNGTLKKAVLSGMVELLKTEVKIPDKIEDEIPVIEIENPLEENLTYKEQERVDAQASPYISYDIDIKSLQPFYVRGRGLNSEWQVDLKMLGTFDKPTAKGGIRLKRGTFDLVGKTITLSEGEVKFSSSLLNPFFSVQGRYNKDMMNITMQVSGTPDKFDIKLSSDPALSEKEILSYFIFGKSDGELTMAQALQLANSVATLKGSSSFDVLGKVRKAFGLDTLSFNAGKEGSFQEGSISLGKTLREGVYVSIDQGLTPEDTKAVIDIDIAPSVVLETEVSPSSTGSVGLKYKWDY